MNRRNFLKSSAAVPAAATLASLPGLSRADAAPWSDGASWNRYEVTTRVDLQRADGAARVWLPLPLTYETDWFKALNNSWSGNATSMRVIEEPKYGNAVFYAEWTQPVEQAYIEVTSSFATRDRAINLALPRKFEPAERAVLERYLAATEYMPTDGIVRDTAQKAVKGARTEVDKVRGIYEWIVENTYRDPKTRGCGIGNVKAMFETGNFGGKCGDLNAAFVAMCRSVGIPARDVYGIRVDASKWGYKSLGVGSSNITRAQHCRAEVYLAARGWVPMDPADVRKVVLEEPPGNLRINDDKVILAREKLFGAWEMNWLAFNFAHDVKLPNGQGAPIAFLMYPNAETADGRKDSLDPDSFKYQITSKKLA